MKRRLVARWLWIAAAVCLLAAAAYEWRVPGRQAVRSEVDLNQRIEMLVAAADAPCQGWLTTPDPDGFVRRMWAMNADQHEWNQGGMSFYLLHGNQPLYWIHHTFADSAVLNQIARWGNEATPEGTVCLDAVDSCRVLVFARSGSDDRRSVVVLRLCDPQGEGANEAVFGRSDTRIERPSAQGERLTLAGQQVSVVWPHYPRFEGWVAVVGWVGVLAALLAFSLWLGLHTSRRGVWRNLVLYFLGLALLRVGFYYVDFPQGGSYSWSSVYSVFVTELMFLVYFLYAYSVRRKAAWHTVRWSKAAQWAAMIAATAVVVGSILYFHYAMIQMIYRSMIVVEIYNIFSMSLRGFVFYLIASIFVAYRIFYSLFSRTVFARFNPATQMTVSVVLLAAMALPLADALRHTVWFLLAAHLVFVLLSLGKSRRASRMFVGDIVVMTFYVSLLTAGETSTAKLNDAKTYAKELAAGNLHYRIPYGDVTYSIVSYSSVQLRPGHQIDLSDVVPFLGARTGEVVERGGTVHVVEPGLDDKSVVVSYPATSLLDLVSLMCYVFLGFYLVSGVMLRLVGVDVYDWGSIKMLSTRIRFIVIGVVLCAMFVVAWVVYRYSDKSYKSRKREVFNTAVSGLLESLSRYCRDKLPPDAVLDAAQTDSLILAWYDQRGSAFNAQVTFYDTGGRKIGGSAVGRSMPSLMEGEAYRTLAYYGLPYFDRYGSEWSQVYALLFVQGHKAGYLNITTRDQTDAYERFALLGSIFNVFVILVILSVLLSMVLYSVVARPLRMLTASLGGIGRLQKIPVPRGQKMDDEVGQLIVQYNRTIDYLDESYRALARSEREGAWREMARQVAHEIKNPLTPMQLKIQMLQRARASGDNGRICEQLDSTLSVLLEQIGVLTKIASDFSDLARFDQTAMVRVDLGQLVQSQAALFDNAADIELMVEVPVCPLYVMGSYVPLSRLLVNVLQNARQAIAEAGEIRVRVFDRDERAVVEIADTGKGIEPALLERIFEPNFTTKSSGSGLGLAMCRQIVESMNGTISVESTPGVGSTFTITLPIA